jgi:hypothetical protein
MKTSLPVVNDLYTYLTPWVIIRSLNQKGIGMMFLPFMCVKIIVWKGLGKKHL